jgi:hypothetical protein
VPRWAEHVYLETAQNRQADSEKVFKTVLGASGDELRSGALWFNWAEMKWLSNEVEAAKAIIGKSTGQGLPDTSVAILRVKRELDQRASEPTHAFSTRIHWIRLRSLFELLFSKDIDSATTIFEDHLIGGDISSEAKESLITASVLLLYQHFIVLKHPGKPSLLRDHVERALCLFPDNTVLWGVFLEAEQGYGIWGRVRRMLGSVQEKSVSRRVLEIWIAMRDRRWDAEVDRVRAGLTIGLDNGR